MKDDLNPQKSFLKKTLVPTAVTGGGLCGLVDTVTLIEVLGPMVVVAGGVAGGAGVYHWFSRRDSSNKHPES